MDPDCSSTQNPHQFPYPSHQHKNDGNENTRTKEVEDHVSAMAHLGQEDRGCKPHCCNRAETVIPEILTAMDLASLSSLKALFFTPIIL